MKKGGGGCKTPLARVRVGINVKSTEFGLEFTAIGVSELNVDIQPLNMVCGWEIVNCWIAKRM